MSPKNSRKNLMNILLVALIAVIVVGAAYVLISDPAESPEVLTVEEALSDKGKKGGKAVVLGGGRNGAEVATYLASKGGKVTIIRRSSMERLEKDVGRGKPTRLQREIYPELWGIATDLPRRYRMQLIKTLGMYDVKVIYGAKTEKITDKGVSIEKDGVKNFIEADTVVIALGETPNDKLYGKLFCKVPELYMVGDCVKSRGMMEAISEGAYVALKI